MKCNNCGNELKEGDSFCSNCGTVVNNNNNTNNNNTIETSQTNNTSDNNITTNTTNKISTPTILCIISIMLTGGNPLLYAFLSIISTNMKSRGLFGFFPLIGLALAIYTRIKYPESKFAKVLLIIYIIFIIATIIFIALVIALCNSLLQECGNSNLGIIINTLF